MIHFPVLFSATEVARGMGIVVDRQRIRTGKLSSLALTTTAPGCWQGVVHLEEALSCIIAGSLRRVLS